MKTFTGLQALRGLMALTVALTFSGAALSADPAYPSRPVRVIVPFGTGTGIDTIGRLVGGKISDDLKQPVLVENRAGAGGAVGAIAVARSAPDGYTLLMAASPFTVAAGVDSKIGYDPIKEFTPVAKVVTVPLLVAMNAKRPFNDARQLLAFAKANPKKLTFGTAGPGTSAQLEMELWARAAGVEMLEIQYKDNTQLVTDLVEGRIDMYSGVAPVLMPHVQGGRLRIMAIVDSRRMSALPDVPTVAESAGATGGYQGTPNWYAFFAPAGTPEPIVSRLHGFIQKAATSPDMEKLVQSLGGYRYTGTTEQFAQEIKAEVERTAKLAKALGIGK